MRNQMFVFMAIFLVWGLPAQANIKEVKAYKEAFEGSKPKCINCHISEKPKKDEGLHDWNDYGKAAKALNEKPTSVDFKKLGTFEDFAAKPKSVETPATDAIAAPEAAKEEKKDGK